MNIVFFLALCKEFVCPRRSWFSASRFRKIILSTGSEEMGVFGVGSIPVAILPACQYMKLLHHNCIEINIVG